MEKPGTPADTPHPPTQTRSDPSPKTGTVTQESRRRIEAELATALDAVPLVDHHCHGVRRLQRGNTQRHAFRSRFQQARSTDKLHRHGANKGHQQA